MDKLIFSSPCINYLLQKNDVWGIRKIIIQYIGIACNTTFTITFLPNIDRILPLQQFIFFHTLSLIKLKIAFLLLPTQDENPRYLPPPSPNYPCFVYIYPFVLSSKTILDKHLLCYQNSKGNMQCCTQNIKPK